MQAEAAIARAMVTPRECCDSGRDGDQTPFKRGKRKTM